MAFPPLIETPTEAAIERAFERLQDRNKDGFDNLGSVDSFLRGPSTTTSFKLNGQQGDDRILLYGTGDDIIHTGSGDDVVFAGRGDDEVHGGSGIDRLSGGDGRDKLSGGSSRDILSGGENTDELYGGTGDDTLSGGEGSDILAGGRDNDTIFGDDNGGSLLPTGNDFLFGGAGHDILNGGGGSDRMTGGSGADTFVFGAQTDFVFGHADIIQDFSRADNTAARQEKIDLRGVDAITGGSNQAFDFVSGPSSVAGTLWLRDIAGGGQKVVMNVDGGAPDLEIIVKFETGITGLSETDFFL